MLTILIHHNNSVDMVGHNDPFIQMYPREMT